MKFVHGLIFVLLFDFLLTAQSLPASSKAIHFTCSFLERVAGSSWQTADERRFLAPIDSHFYFSMGNFSYRLQAAVVQDTVIQLSSQVNCLDDRPRNFFQQNIVFRGASVFFDSALTRGQSVYRIKLTFDSLSAWRSDCDLAFGGDNFASDPSGDFDFYYVKRSLGDFRWNEIRDAFENDLNGFIERYAVSDRTKTNFYICPCPVTDVGWDPRWNNAYDYSRQNVFAHFEHGVNDLHPEVVYMTRLMRIHGYAPAFLLEGLCSSLDYAEIFIRDALRKNKLPDIASLGVSRQYRAVARDTSLYISGSFVNYLFNTFGRGKLLQWYQTATDLTFAESFTAVYGKPLAEVTADWKKYVLATPPKLGALSYFATRAQTFLKLPEQLIYANTGYAELKDTAWAPRLLTSLHFTFGDFKKAAQYAGELARLNPQDAGMRQMYANMLFAAGNLDSAALLYSDVIENDTASYQSAARLAQIDQIRGRHERAIELLRRARESTGNPGFQVDYDIAIGDSYAALGQRDTSWSYYQRALDMGKQLAAAYNNNPLHHLRTGRAALRLGSLEVAQEYLNTALFLEERMFYIGQILLASAQVADLRKDRKEAIALYKELLTLPTAYADRQQAQAYLKKPYQN